MLQFLLFAIATFAVAAICYWQWVESQKRRDALFVFATSRGWTFTVAENSLANRWVGEPFGRGDRHRATNAIRGTVGTRSLTAFDYTYDTKDSDGDRTTHHAAVVVVGMPAYLPTLQVTPESWVGRAASALGVTTDIALESEDFNRRFAVDAYDAKFASDVLNPRTMHLLLNRPNVAFRLQGTDLISWTAGSLTPLTIIERASTLDAVLAGIPEFVWRDHGVASR